MNTMPDDDRIGSLLREAASTFHAPAGLQDQVRDALAGPARPGRPPRWGRMVVAALATVTGAAAVLALLLWPSSTTMAMTMAEMVAALDETPWVHIRYDTGDNVWISVPEGIYASNRASGTYTWSDYGRGRRWRWGSGHPDTARHIVETDIDREPMRGTVWERIVGHLEKQAEAPDPARAGWTVEPHRENVDGVNLVRFDSYQVDPAGRRLLIKQVWADPATRLPVRLRERVELAYREQLGVEYAVGVFEFPETGPQSVYDLGVPADLPVVRREAGGPISPEAEAILASIRAARDRFPEHYRVLVWVDPRRTGEVERMYFSGRPNWKDLGGHELPWYDTVRIRRERYALVDDALEGRDAPEDVAAWIEGQAPFTLEVSDGARTFSQRGPLRNVPLEVQVLEVKRITGLNSGDWIVELQWPLYDWAYASIQIVEAGPDVPAGTVCLRSDLGTQRTDYFVDPARDFICVHQRLHRLVDGEWRLDADHGLAGFVQLAGGQWVASRRVAGDGRTVRHLDVTVLEADEIPEALFDVDALLEQARRDGAIIETY